MGYESRIYVCEKSDYISEDEDRVWAECLGSFNLCKISGRLLRRIEAFPETKLYFIDNGQEIRTDRYGDVPNEVPLADMIDILEKEIAVDDYRRYAPCLGLLKGFEPAKWNNLVCLHYGY